MLNLARTAGNLSNVRACNCKLLASLSTRDTIIRKVSSLVCNSLSKGGHAVKDP